MSFAFEIKKEVLMKELSIEQAQSFVAGLITTAGQRDGSKIILKFNNPETSEVVRDLVSQLKIKNTTTQENKNHIVISEYEPLAFNEVKLLSNFFAGAFVGGGSISDVDSTSYHLELQLNSHQNALMLQAFLNKYDAFNFTLIQRRNQFVLYLKKSEEIADFMRAIEAFDNLMIFENTRISRDMQNQLNRYSNLDVYNQQKLVDANIAFKEQYAWVKKKNLQKLFNEMEVNFYELKEENEFSSLAELTQLMNEKYNLKKTRAGLNHWLIKLRNIYEDSK